MQANHIAVLVRDLKAVAASIPKACTLHAPEEQVTEGTREQYATFGGDSVPALLLIQAVAAGPYARALEKRGPGLHHIGCLCADIENEVLDSRGRFLLHPVSLRTRKFGTVRLCRPGVPYLVELMQDAEQSTIKHEEIEVALPVGTPLPPFACELASNLRITVGNGPAIEMVAGGIRVTIDPTQG